MSVGNKIILSSKTECKNLSFLPANSILNISCPPVKVVPAISISNTESDVFISE